MNNETVSRDFDAEAKERGVVLARFFALTDDGDEVFERATKRVAAQGDIARVIARCADYGEQAELLDAADYVRGVVDCDGTLEWLV